MQAIILRSARVDNPPSAPILGEMFWFALRWLELEEKLKCGGLDSNGVTVSNLHPLFASDRISSHMTRPARTMERICITTYPAGVARNSFTELRD